ncbi:OmpA family protein [Fluviicola chungangensis]|uniref:OmpA family protein n=1 Tax=Fluviicola chungangensis TaxID=2597671 RepID=A0A556N3H9_9FLAO|nr:OmpA family protein [Fluviicola chungangensis]TSJ46776.1 OmpA family protein [Fluviicola chungangensis]
MKSIILLPILLFLPAFCQGQAEVLKDSISAFFGYNQSEILDGDYILSQLEKIEASSVSLVKLVGYTDSTGSLKRNMELAADRMQSVEFLLKSASMNHVKIETVNANETSGYRIAPDELNRRVDVLVYIKAPVAGSAIRFELNKPVNLNINFVGGKADFLTSSFPNLEKLKTIMLEDTTLLVKLHGHVCCDNDMPLSVKRAEAVMEYLISNGVNKNRMRAEGFSNSMELVPDDSEVHMSMNRRVEAIFYRKTE